MKFKIALAKSFKFKHQVLPKLKSSDTGMNICKTFSYSESKRARERETDRQTDCEDKKPAKGLSHSVPRLQYDTKDQKAAFSAGGWMLFCPEMISILLAFIS